ncbi:hypothetical protein TVAG_130440 [Trichomonas vaginalis G3]|uniref:BRCT domain-containing protein n=1 Tax=Trichomonas vaginalis (strain ATCC PRA-98 / G3) TaxID=412133 RepID=A2G8Z4_TRIV3|nr:BRCT domain family [Trichomonas vaginalis G3]EAX86374.1 hypothetical protein TVAG_130440 [Trichomonas vaginalis G3]KAI5506795.1 BRCT domain family [Trichomonas vaginalis G3]|eukprot:XP_001299304.1 hypothetical protein [Trichomonas vaginalis G3]
MRFIWFSPLLKENETRELQEVISQFFPGAKVTTDKSISQVLIVKPNEVSLIYRTTSIILSPLAFKQCTTFGIDPFEWPFNTKTRMNLFLRNKTIKFVGFDDHTTRSLTHMIHQMHGSVGDLADFVISPKAIKSKDKPDCPVVSPNWIEALYISQFYVDYSQFTFGRNKPKAKVAPKPKKLTATKSPREIAKDFDNKSKDTTILRLQIKEKTPDIMKFFVQKSDNVTKNIITPKIPKSPHKNTKIPMPDNPFQQPNTDTMIIDSFLKKSEEEKNSSSPTFSPRTKLHSVCNTIINTKSDSKNQSKCKLNSIFENCIQFTQKNEDTDFCLSDDDVVYDQKDNSSEISCEASVNEDPLMMALVN